VVDFAARWSDRAELPQKNLVAWIGLATSKFYDWKKRYGKVNEHNALVPRDAWLLDGEKRAILDYERRYPLEGYRRLTFMMLDDDIAAASPSSVYRVLRDAGRLQAAPPKQPLKGTGFVQPLGPHEHWHTDVSHVNIAGTYYFLISVLDGFSRLIVHWEIREHMTECDVAIVLERARQQFPEARPRIISDNGPQFLACDFKEFIRIAGMTHVRTSPYYPQSNGKKERWFGTLKQECIRPHVPLSLEDARRLVARFVEHYNTVRLHSSLGYVAPADKLLGLERVIFADRDQKLEAAREQRRIARQTEHATAATSATASSAAATPNGAPSAAATPNGSTSAAAPSASTGKSPPPPRTGLIDFAALRHRIGFEPVLEQLGFDRALVGSGPQRRGPCPLHDTPDSTSRSFSVNLRKNLFCCFDPKCSARGNVLDFWMRLRSLPIADAARDLCAQFGIRPDDLSVPNRRSREEATRTSSTPCFKQTHAYDSVPTTSMNPLTPPNENSISR
jgi:transposase InsO family protein